MGMLTRVKHVKTAGTLQAPLRSSTHHPSSSLSRPRPCGQHGGQRGACAPRAAFPTALFLQPSLSRWIEPDSLHTWQPNEAVSLATIMKARKKKSSFLSHATSAAQVTLAGKQRNCERLTWITAS